MNVKRTCHIHKYVSIQCHESTLTNTAATSLSTHVSATAIHVIATAIHVVFAVWDRNRGYVYVCVGLLASGLYSIALPAHCTDSS